MLKRFKNLFDTRHDHDENCAIDSAIRAGQRIGAKYQALQRVPIAQSQRIVCGGAAPTAILVMTLAAKQRLRDELFELTSAGIAVRFVDAAVEVLQVPLADWSKR